MNIEDIVELKLIDVLHRGEANSECIAIQVKAPVNMAQFGLLIGVSAGNNLATPLNDSFFWFGEGMVQPNEWILVYTCEGKGRISKGTDGQNVYAVHWGRKATMFANSSLVPILVRIGGVAVGKPLLDQPQMGQLTHRAER